MKRIGKSGFAALQETMKIEDLAKPAKMRSIIKSHNICSDLQLQVSLETFFHLPRFTVSKCA